MRILWAVFFVLFRVVAFLNLYLYTSYEERWLLLLLNVVLIAISVVQYLTNKKALIFNRSRALMMTVLVVVLHTGAIVCNFMGLFNLAKVLTASATFGLFTAIVLHVFVDVIKEALTFQLAHLRILFLTFMKRPFEVVSTTYFDIGISGGCCVGGNFPAVAEYFQLPQRQCYGFSQ